MTDSNPSSVAAGGGSFIAHEVDSLNWFAGSFLGLALVSIAASAPREKEGVAGK